MRGASVRNTSRCASVVDEAAVGRRELLRQEVRAQVGVPQVVRPPSAARTCACSSGSACRRPSATRRRSRGSRSAATHASGCVAQALDHPVEALEAVGAGRRRPGLMPRIRSVATTSCIGRRIFWPFECLKIFEPNSSCSTGTIAVSCCEVGLRELGRRAAAGCPRRSAGRASWRSGARSRDGARGSRGSRAPASKPLFGAGRSSTDQPSTLTCPT